MNPGKSVQQHKIILATVKWVGVLLLFPVYFVTFGLDVVQAGCTNIVATTNMRSHHTTYEISNDWVNPCINLSRDKNFITAPWIRQYGIYLQEQKDPASALLFWRNAVDEGAMDLLVLIHLGLAEIESGQLELAANTLSKVAGTERLLDRLGQQQLEQGLYGSALNTYLVATQLAPDSAIAWRGVARGYSGQEDLVAAVNAYQIALTNSPEDHESHYELGMLLWKIGDHEEAMYYLGEAVELTPEASWIGFRNILALVRVQRVANQSHEALQTAKEALRRFPLDPYAYYELGETERRFGSKQQAIINFERAILLRPENPLFHFALGSMYWELLDYQEALNSLQEAVSLQPENVLYLYQYGLALEATKDFCGAERIYHFAIELDIDFQPPQDRLMLLLNQGAILNCR